MLPAALLACALNVAPATMDRIVGVESGGNPLALHVNLLAGQQPTASSVKEAAEIAARYISAGYSVDLGLSQLNSKNLPVFRYSLEDAFDDCKNIKAGAAVLSAFYGLAVRQFGEGQDALRAALKGYHTGSIIGDDSAYLARYYINVPVPTYPAPTSRIVKVNGRKADTEVWR